jgi:two-component system chemotaxis sensor kinase CheA
MTLVGELVLARNRLVQSPGPDRDPGFDAAVQRLDGLTTDLQAGVMKTRRQPIATVWARLPRVVRDLAAALGKAVRLDMAGTDTELDRTVVEAIKDPLTHLVRNAVGPRDRAAGRSHRPGQAGRGAATPARPRTRAARWWWRSPTTAAGSTRPGCGTPR